MIFQFQVKPFKKVDFLEMCQNIKRQTPIFPNWKIFCRYIFEPHKRETTVIVLEKTKMAILIESCSIETISMQQNFPNFLQILRLRVKQVSLRYLLKKYRSQEEF